MEPGDKVWWFDAATKSIHSGVIYGGGEDDNGLWTGSVRDDEFPTHLRFSFGTELFSSREALCEHYRKIFT